MYLKLWKTNFIVFDGRAVWHLNHSFFTDFQEISGQFYDRLCDRFLYILVFLVGGEIVWWDICLRHCYRSSFIEKIKDFEW